VLLKVHEEMRLAYQREWQESRKALRIYNRRLMSLTPKLAITLNSMPSAAAYCWQKKEYLNEWKRIFRRNCARAAKQTIDGTAETRR